MLSFREIIRNEVLDKLLEDVRDLHIFNEADMQSRLALHLHRYCQSKLYLRNQPFMPVGQRRGKRWTKPDVVVFNEEASPIAAVELKCFLDKDARACATMEEHIWRDIDKLRDFRTRYDQSKNAFAIALVNIADANQHVEFQQAFARPTREPWMSHYLYVHVVNVYCDENGRKRRWYDGWHHEWQELHGAFARA